MDAQASATGTQALAPLYENALTELEGLDWHISQAGIVTWQGRKVLKLSGLALTSDLSATDATIEVQIGADGPCYPGVAFRVQDSLNYELAYAQPHSAGLWDAVQYDPVFHGSNTWQIYHGPPYQQMANVPLGKWFSLRVDVLGRRAAISVDGQPPLIVEHLAHAHRRGLFGLWTYLPAYFSDLRISPCLSLPPGSGSRPISPAHAIRAWLLDGFGVVACEPNGILNLNRILPLSVKQVRLLRRIVVSEESDVTLSFGFSDELKLEIDGDEVFSGTNTFTGMSKRAARGYVEPAAHTVTRRLDAGVHDLIATLKVSEGFGWGLAMALQGEHVSLLPARRTLGAML